MNELEERLLHRGAFKRDGKIFCWVHGSTELNADGSCDQCNETDAIIGAVYQETRAMNAAQEVYENDNRVWL